MRGLPLLSFTTSAFVAAGVDALGSDIPTNLFKGLRQAGCPLSCKDVGSNPSNWTQLHRTKDLARCDGEFLLDMTVQNTDLTQNRMRVCKYTDGGENFALPASVNTTRRSTALQVYNNCGASLQTVSISATIGTTGVNNFNISSAATAADQLQAFLADGATCGSTIMFSKVDDVMVGMYVGGEISKESAGELVSTFSDEVANGAASSLEFCDSTSSSGGSKTFGIFAGPFGDFKQVQDNVKTWANSRCLSTSSNTTISKLSLDFLVSTLGAGSNGTHTNSSSTNATSISARAYKTTRHSNLRQRDTCSYTEVYSGDTCPSLASECGISDSDFDDYNVGSDDVDDFCNNLAVGQFVCCSDGDLPDFLPQENDDGSCYSYTIIADDTCSAVADAHYITVDDIYGFNNGSTWGWAGCESLAVGQLICLSEGTPPFPAAVTGAECGPTVVGTIANSSANVSELNPCPLNACCDAWGYCGTTTDFCTITLADTLSPGTHKNGTNGCISNCGTDIISESDPVDTPMYVGYFEGWNYNRSCLYMDVSQIPSDNYTHVHFAYGDISSDFVASVDSADQTQWAKFAGNDDFPYKRILSFGGWAFSTGTDTYNIFREGVTEANRHDLAVSILDLVIGNWMDGVDFDWEYPGEPDIEGIPAGSEEDGANYLAFLKEVRSIMGDDRTISICLPASYWYLKAFPVAEMAEVVDYFVFMTYDLHGQWDYGNDNADVGCADGNCLRSHVNKTETESALSMLTKAGVSSHKIVMGVSLYGRSFRMTDSSCTGPECTYTGGYDESYAEPGICTDTAGYLADAEIYDIIDDPTYNINDNYYDADSDSNILVYGNDSTTVDWVAYENYTTRTSRARWAIDDLHMAGTIAWAIDLEEDQDYVDDDNSTSYVIAALDLSCDPDGNPGSLDALNDQADDIEPFCWNLYALDILTDTLAGVLDNYTDASDGYDSVYSYYVEWVKDEIDPQLQDYMDLDTGAGPKYFTCDWKWGTKTGSETCPPAAKFWQEEADYTWTITLTLEDEDGFYDAISSDLGIEKDWVKFDEYKLTYFCADTADDVRVGGGTRPCRKLQNKWENFPMKSDSVTVTNPKDIIEAASSNITDLQATLAMGQFQTIFTTFEANDSSSDAVTATAMPIFMLQSAVDSMFSIKSIGEKAKDEEKKNLILEILGIVLLFIPFVGEGIAEIADGAVWVTRIATLIGEVGNAALGIQEIASDPTSAPWVILTLLVGAAGYAKSDEAVFKEAAAAREGMTADQIAKFSTEIQEKDSLVTNIVNRCIERGDVWS